MFKKKYFLFSLIVIFLIFDSIGFFVNNVKADETITPFDYYYAPDNSFGIKETKTINWTFFKNWINNNFGFRAEYKINNNDEWQLGNEYLTINKTWNDTGFYKITILLNVPIDLFSIRFIFYSNINILDYIERNNYEITFNYTFNNDETYSLFFNWSDIANIPNLTINKLIYNNKVYVMFKKDNIKSGIYEFDPILGDDTVLGSITSVENQIVGSEYICQDNCIADNITVYLTCTSTWNGNIKCGLYYYNNQSFYVSTVERFLSITGGVNDWYVFNFTDTVYLVNGETYIVVVFADSVTGSLWVNYGTGTQHRLKDTTNYPTWQDPIDSWDYNYSTYNTSIYCSYHIPDYVPLHITMLNPLNNSENTNINNLTFYFKGMGTITYDISLTNNINFSGTTTNDTIVICFLIYQLSIGEKNVFANISDINSIKNDTFNFTIIQPISGGIVIIQNSNNGIIGITSIFGVIGCVFIFRWFRKKKTA